MESESKHSAEKKEPSDVEPKPYETPELTVYGRVETETCNGPSGST